MANQSWDIHAISQWHNHYGVANRYQTRVTYKSGQGPAPEQTKQTVVTSVSANVKVCFVHTDLALVAQLCSTSGLTLTSQTSSFTNACSLSEVSQRVHVHELKGSV